MVIYLLVAGFSLCNRPVAPENDYIVAAYVWPSCHNDAIAEEKLWSEGVGEWEMIRKGTPRYPQKGKKDVIHLYNTPESFSTLLFKAKEYANEHPQQPKLIVINAWNEWVEGSYLEPDMKYGYGYLEAVKDVIINGQYKN